MTNNEEELPLCECGCGEPVARKGNRFIHGHNGRGVSLSPERCAAMSATNIGIPHTTIAQLAADKAHSKRMTGVPNSPEHNSAISESTLGKPRTSPAQIAANETISKKLRGGLDLVWHHIAYDFLRPEALRVRITRKFHGQIHSPKGLPVTERGYSLID